MKRKITTQEQILINNGYRLSSKEYGGRKSEKTLTYYYTKGNAYIMLDSKREKIISFGLLNYNKQKLTKLDIDELRMDLYKIECDTRHVEEEMVRVEPTKGTFEEIDEMSHEKERNGN